jgi:hypothetical protein
VSGQGESVCDKVSGRDSRRAPFRILRPGGLPLGPHGPVLFAAWGMLITMMVR